MVFWARIIHGVHKALITNYRGINPRLLGCWPKETVLTQIIVLSSPRGRNWFSSVQASVSVVRISR